MRRALSLLGGRKQRSVLALLLLEAPRPVPTDRLIDVLWGEQPPRTAATSLQNFVSQLRKTLGSDVLVTKAPGYALAIRAGAGRSQPLSRSRFAEAEQPTTLRERAVKLRDRARDLARPRRLRIFEFEAFRPCCGELRSRRSGSRRSRNGSKPTSRPAGTAS